MSYNYEKVSLSQGMVVKHYWLFTVGTLGVGLMAIPTLAGSAA